MKWSNEYATGVERLDEQHRMIFTMAEDFRTALNAGRGERVYAGLLKSLELYIRGHFGYEENCMEQYRCPVAGRNKEAHAKFAQVLAGYQQRHTTGVFDVQEAHRLVDTLDKWLASHICKIDVKLKEVVR
jgi:hemerythrin